MLLVLEPGTYDVGDTALPIWSWMTIEGAGERLTVITGAACSGATRTGTIHIESDYSGLRHLGVENRCADSNGVGLEIEGDRAWVEHVEKALHVDVQDPSTTHFRQAVPERL